MGGTAMAGLLDKIARQVLNGLEPKKTNITRPKTMSQTTYRQPVMVVPVTTKAVETEPEVEKEAVIITLEKEMTTENIIVENVPENTNNVSADYALKDDYLLKQIDEFRAKAQQLQALLATKESKVQELQEIVEEREGKAKEFSLHV